MKFFLNITLISNCPFLNWAYPYGAQGTLGPSRQLSFQYSKLHNPPPKSADPNIASSVQEIPVAADAMNDPLISLPIYLCSEKEDIRHAYGYGPCSQHLLEYGHSQNYRSGSEDHGSDAGGPHEEQDNDILSPIQYGNSNYLLNESSFDSSTSNKAKTFIETKVTAMKLQGLNL